MSKQAFYLKIVSELFKSGLIVLLTTFLWVLFYQLNIIVLYQATVSPMVSWIFLPAGIKVITVIIFGELGVLGLFFGAIATYYISNLNAGSPLLVAAISASSPFVAIHVSKYVLKLNSFYTKLKGIHLWIISFIYAITNTLFHQLYYGVHMRNLVGFANNQFAMFCGDLFGVLLLLFILSSGIKYLKFSYKKSN